MNWRHDDVVVCKQKTYEFLLGFLCVGFLKNSILLRCTRGGRETGGSGCAVHIQNSIDHFPHSTNTASGQIGRVFKPLDWAGNDKAIFLPIILIEMLKIEFTQKYAFYLNNSSYFFDCNSQGTH